MLGIWEVGQPTDYFGSRTSWNLSAFIGRSIVGIRAGDVVRLTRMLQQNSETEEIYALARIEIAPVLLHAAAFEPAIAHIALIQPYSSYLSIVSNRFYNHDFIDSTVLGALKGYDLPDLAASPAPKILLMTNVTDGSDEIDPENIANDLEIIITAYQTRAANGQLKIKSGKPTDKPYEDYMEWLK